MTGSELPERGLVLLQRLRVEPLAREVSCQVVGEAVLGVHLVRIDGLDDSHEFREVGVVREDEGLVVAATVLERVLKRPPGEPRGERVGLLGEALDEVQSRGPVGEDDRLARSGVEVVVLLGVEGHVHVRLDGGVQVRDRLRDEQPGAVRAGDESLEFLGAAQCVAKE